MVQQIRAALVAKGIGDKRINDVMAVLSKALRYAVDAEVIDHSPKIRFRKTERPENRGVGLGRVRARARGCPLCQGSCRMTLAA